MTQQKAPGAVHLVGDHRYLLGQEKRRQRSLSSPACWLLLRVVYCIPETARRIWMRYLCLLVWLVCWAAPLRAQTPACDLLTGEKKKLADSLLASKHPHDCCDKTFSECLREKPTCALAVRLAENICRRVDAGQKQAEISRALSKRASFFLSNKKFAIDLAAVPVVGEPGAPVELVEYACARCPFCSKITPELYRAVTEGALRGKARLYLKTFPIRSHQHAKEAAMGFMAAAEMGRFWEFLLLAYGRFDAFCPLKQGAWAEETGMDKATFERLLPDERLREMLVDSIKEGLRNGVDATPAFFINRKRFAGDLTTAEIIDVVEDEFDRLRQTAYLNP